MFLVTLALHIHHLDGDGNVLMAQARELVHDGLRQAVFLHLGSARQNFGDHMHKRRFAIAQFEILVGNGTDFDIGTIGQKQLAVERSVKNGLYQAL